ncbi:DUF4430 domain-containing protein [Candidatus Uhrbacteria bacterium]|nr:DUF4430 domain-containing protein [Candidatus Uhrbacteria bacterium]
MLTRGLKFFGVTLVLIGVGFLLGWSVQAPTPLQPTTSDTGGARVAHLIIDADTGHLQTFPNEPFFAGATVFDILKAVTTRTSMPFVYDPPGAYGVFIRQIGGKKNGTEKKYWQYWVNGQFAMVAADKQVLQSGDTLLWKFTGEQQE